MTSIISRSRGIIAVGIALLALTACAGTPTKGYEGAAMPADQTAVVRSGAYTDMVSYDGTRVSSPSVALLPGEHTIMMKPTDREDVYSGHVGAYFVYSRVTGSVVFNAEAGHRYVAYVSFSPGPQTEDQRGSGYVWFGYIQDETTHQRVASTDRLALEIGNRSLSYGGGGSGASHH